MKTFAIIPALNEYIRMPSVLDQVLQFVDGVIIVDDGSGQPLQETLPKRERVKFVRHEINLGKGAAMTTGVAAARNLGVEAVVFLDADGQHDPREIPLLVQPLREGRADIVFGARSFHKDMPWVAKIGNIFLTTMLSWLFHIKVRDTQSGFRAFRIASYPQLRWQSPRYAVETEMLVNAGKHHVPWAEVSIRTIYLDGYRGTTVLDGIKIFINMLAWRLQ